MFRFCERCKLHGMVSMVSQSYAIIWKNGTVYKNVQITYVAKYTCDQTILFGEFENSIM